MSEIAKLIKDVVLFVLFGFIGLGVAASSGETAASVQTFLFIMFGFLPFGWSWASHIVTAVSLYGILLKGGLSMFLGIAAGPVTLGMDIFSLVAYAKER